MQLQTSSDVCFEPETGLDEESHRRDSGNHQGMISHLSLARSNDRKKHSALRRLKEDTSFQRVRYRNFDSSKRAPKPTSLGQKDINSHIGPIIGPWRSRSILYMVPCQQGDVAFAVPSSYIVARYPLLSLLTINLRARIYSTMETHTIRHPRDLPRVLDLISNTTKPQDGQLCIEFALLQPLVEPEMLASCRGPAPLEPIGPTNKHEYLNITNLRNEWRRQWRQLPTVSNSLGIKFDTSLPRFDDGTRPLGMRWTTDHVDECKVYVFWEDLRNLAILMGTFAKLRTDAGGTVRFEVIANKSDRLSKHYAEQLDDYLQKLAAF